MKKGKVGSGWHLILINKVFYFCPSHFLINKDDLGMDCHSAGIYWFCLPSIHPPFSGSGTTIYLHLEKKVICSLLSALVVWVGLTPFQAPGLGSSPVRRKWFKCTWWPKWTRRGNLRLFCFVLFFEEKEEEEGRTEREEIPFFSSLGLLLKGWYLWI